MDRNYWDCKKYMITLQGLGCINFTKITAASATHYFHETSVHLYLFTKMDLLYHLSESNG